MEHDGEKTASANAESSDSKTAASKAALKRIAGYAMRGSPALAVLALIVAALAVTDNLSNRAQLSLATSKVDSLNASLSASKSAMEELKFAMIKNKAMLEGERKKNEELAAEIIRNITNLQIKMKIYPTLEEQLVQRASTAAPASSITSIPEHR